VVVGDDVLRGVVVLVGEGVFVGAGDQMLLAALGLPVMVLPLASRPLLPVLFSQDAGKSAASQARSMEIRGDELPAGHAPPAALAVSISSPAGSYSRSVSPLLFSAPL